MSAGLPPDKKDSVGLDVNIMGREYRIACKPEEQADLLAAVAYVDAQMREIRDTAKQNNAERVAVLVALNAANELLRARTAGGSSTNAPAANGVDLNGLKRRIQSMQSTIEAALSEQERLL